MPDTPSHDRRKLTDVVAARLRQLIADGTLDVGQKLLPRELAPTLDASEGTVRKAIDILERERLVSVTHGRGTFVLRKPEDPVPRADELGLDAEPVPDSQRILRLLETMADRLDAVENRLSDLENRDDGSTRPGDAPPETDEQSPPPTRRRPRGSTR